jgi:hypothetical protein
MCPKKLWQSKKNGRGDQMLVFFGQLLENYRVADWTLFTLGHFYEEISHILGLL